MQSWPPASQQIRGVKSLVELSDMITAKGQSVCQFLLEIWQDQPAHRSVPGQRAIIFFNGKMFLYHILTSPNSTEIALWT